MRARPHPRNLSWHARQGGMTDSTCDMRHAIGARALGLCNGSFRRVAKDDDTCAQYPRQRCTGASHARDSVKPMMINMTKFPIRVRTRSGGCTCRLANVTKGARRRRRGVVLTPSLPHRSRSRNAHPPAPSWLGCGRMDYVRGSAALAVLLLRRPRPQHAGGSRAHASSWSPGSQRSYLAVAYRRRTVYAYPARARTLVRIRQ
jgi:hypothetical protein